MGTCSINRELIEHVPISTPISTGEPHLAFRLGTARFVCPLGEVREVIPVPELALIPGAPDWVQGLAALRGQPFPVIDLGRHPRCHPELGRAALPAGPLARVVVVGEGVDLVGVVVDELLGVMRAGGGAADPRLDGWGEGWLRLDVDGLTRSRIPSSGPDA